MTRQKNTREARHWHFRFKPWELDSLLRGFCALQRDLPSTIGQSPTDTKTPSRHPHPNAPRYYGRRSAEKWSVGFHQVRDALATFPFQAVSRRPQRLVPFT